VKTFRHFGRTQCLIDLMRKSTLLSAPDVTVKYDLKDTFSIATVLRPVHNQIGGGNHSTGC